MYRVPTPILAPVDWLILRIINANLVPLSQRHSEIGRYQQESLAATAEILARFRALSSVPVIAFMTNPQSGLSNLLDDAGFQILLRHAHSPTT